MRRMNGLLPANALETVDLAMHVEQTTRFNVG